ncbi:exodeoxyribonuclease VII large subunit [Candidatus Uhrbacteria bacterium]|nr:exodeoxyribonuclease VII large subunit [Candidatus Uhrbacteria bacterium]
MTNNLEPIFSVSEFVEYINLAIGRRKVVVEGEVSSFHVNQGKWIFFDLKDDESKISCFMLAYSLDVACEDGMKVRVTGSPRVHGKSGKFSIFVDRIELHGEGALRRAFELTKKKLAAEGLFAPERKRSLPAFPEKIGLIASKESAAYTDFMRILNQRWPGVQISLIHVHVQGDEAVRDIVSAFEWFNVNVGFADVIALIRGGGSLEDLQAFNSEPVARALFSSCIPVVCGVGHERDETLADYVADVRAATPTHAASLVVPDQREVLSHIRVAASTLYSSVSNTLEWHDHTVTRAVGSLTHIFQKTEYAVQNVIRDLSDAIRQAEAKMKEDTRRIADQATFLAVQMEHFFSGAESSVLAAKRNLENMNPLTVLKRGYSIVRSTSGGIVKRLADIHSGDSLSVAVSDGSFSVTVSSQQKQGRLLR